nr:MAG TPA: DNA pilot protein VP2 [Microviridae sp.]
MKLLKSALGMIGGAAKGGLTGGITGGITGAVGSLIGGIFGGNGSKVKDQKKLMELQNQYEQGNMKYQAELNEQAAQANQQRMIDYFNLTAQYNSASQQKQRLKEAGLNPALMYGQAGAGGAGTGATGGAQAAGAGLAQSQAVGMGLELKSIAAQTKLAEANAAKAYAEAEKISGVDTEKTKSEIESIAQGIKESDARIKDLLAGIPSKEQSYYIGKAQERMFESIADLNSITGELNLKNKEKVAMEVHVLTKTYSKLESEIQNIDADTDTKRELLKYIGKKVKSEIELNIARAFQSNQMGTLNREQIKTVNAQIGLWENQADFWSASVENQYKMIENQVYQWRKEWELSRERLNKEEMESIINSIFQAISIAHGLGGKLMMGKFTGK